MTDERAVAWARGLLVAAVTVMLVSTSAAIAIEFTAYLTFLVQPALRRRIAALPRHPLALAFAVFALPIVVGAFYGAGSWHDSLMALFAWRRALLLPLALAVFDDGSGKILAAKSILLVCLVGAAVSFLTAGFGLGLTSRISNGIVFQNYATQGMAMSLALTVAIAALLRPKLVEGDRLLANRWAMAVAALVLIIDIVFVLPGRSGYVTVLVMGTAAVAFLVPGRWTTKAAAALAIAAVLGVLLASSSVTRSRVTQAFNEITTADEAEEGSSLGLRVVWLRHTLRMVADHPVFGVGTGGFADGFRPYVRDLAGWHGTHTGDPHNQFLKFLAEQGLIGLLCVLYFLARAFAYPAPPPFRQVAAAVLLGWCATSLANSHFSTFAESRMIFFWLGAMLAGPPELRNPDRSLT
jgi:O-antigen ligase